MYFLRLISLYTLMLIVTVASCPTNCICKWKGGKQTVECVNKSMITIPDGIDSSTQVFDFSGNNLKTLGSEQFQRLGLVNLQKIFLSRCQLAVLDDRAFKGLTNLVELDLSNNLLSKVPAGAFVDLPSLMKLNLNGNPFKVLKAYTFKNLKYLVTLELSRCELELIENDAFYGLIALEMLKLDYNSLKFIPGVNTIPRRLHGIQLQKNPWFCDCKLTDLYSWLNLTNLPQSVNPTCSGPTRLRGAPIKLLDEQELACPPDVSPTSLYLEIQEGKNVSLLCRVTSEPEARVSWRFQDRALQNDSALAPGTHFYYVVEEGTTEKKSELFIFNANAEDNGTYFCIAENQAGKSQSNYTIRIVLKEEPLLQNKKIPVEHLMALCALIATVVAFMMTCLISCWLRHRVKRKKRRKKEMSKDLALYNDANIQASPITRSGDTLSTISEASMQKVNGSIFIADQGILKMNENMDTVDNSSSVSHIFYPCNTFTPEPNPDLINDTSKERKFVNNFSKSLNDSRSETDPTYASIGSRPEEVSSWSPKTINIPSNDGVRSVPISVCFNQFQSPDTQVMSNKYVVDAYPSDFGVTKATTHFPSVLPATAFYRTLPHKRHNAASSNAGLTQYARDAELLTRSLQPAPYEHFLGSDVRYNVEGYPKDSPSYTFTSTPHVSFSDTVQILGKPSEMSVEPCKGEHQIKVSLLNASAQVNGELAKKSREFTNEVEFKDSKLSVKMKSTSESPDEGYVGECTDTTEV